MDSVSGGFVPMKSIYLRNKKLQIIPNGGGIGDFLSTAVQDGISTTSAFKSPTMFLGGFSILMQPLPNGTEFAGQFTQSLPHYFNLVPVLVHKNFNNDVIVVDNNFKCFIYCLYYNYGWMNEKGNFKYVEMKNTLEESSLEESSIEYLLDSCTEIANVCSI
ncbi:hypothetical protein Phum_PHUM105570 [Pediculus humanus corporis]|uniref:Uncharacterized protein n=1 Tax=Pediculus humanus subsp. corporis TaxID=121224 RepID=E0VD44_PEDHC|nr:uncharacterized protein Phum_PHUM105570 [Pediculus humanus corporis]EEB11300.1 hypothetical protein Phum_PHUM105570 [Pediculus humanus corporis]